MCNHGGLFSFQCSVVSGQFAPDGAVGIGITSSYTVAFCRALISATTSRNGRKRTFFICSSVSGGASLKSISSSGISAKALSLASDSFVTGGGLSSAV